MPLKPQTYQTVSAEEAVALIQSGQHIFVHGAAATPQTLLEALAARAGELSEVTIHHIHIEGTAPHAQPECRKAFRVNNFFVGKNTRAAVNEGAADYVPIFLSEIPLLFRRGIVALDVALLQVSPPDAHGYCSLGTSVDVALAAAQTARILIAEVNPQMPRTHGDGNIHISKFHKLVAVDRPLIQHPVKPLSEVERRIGHHVASLIDNGATLQMGIGAIPNAVLEALLHHKALGVHTEMFSDGLIPLVEAGVVTNEHKEKHRRHIVSGFVVGSQQVYDFIDDNPLVRLLDIAYVNDTAVIRQNPKVVAINSAIEVDLSGQVVSDSIGTRIYSGVGGQMDFIRGAALSDGGKPVIALPSTTSKGLSRITGLLNAGGGVVTTRAHVHYVVTEYGIAYLYGRSLRERAKALINIAHPDHRENLQKQARQTWGLSL
ncbi:acetyl-CoA hydrolase/transferase family protein [Eisenibacter elegans]|jgi:acyl-CoA hydrolase|uniref:acetyl-CoA hydrolase/transferase family protein n=1 Tax=Eisenibacter elegans TaxID=997 RepID=UPI00041D42AC|nr:acetyl-CoA hydrolase/transferase C-terminal domain-containing protein [Eisenibacter elegans]